jgi:hypothetical protein
MFGTPKRVEESSKRRQTVLDEPLPSVLEDIQGSWMKSL